MNDTLTVIRRPRGHEDIEHVSKHVGYAFVPEKAQTHWSARAIWKWGDPGFDLLYDRQQCTGEDEKRKEIAKWLNEVGLKELHEAFVREGFRGSTGDRILIEDGKFGIMGTPNSSHGYAYIGAWMLEDDDA